MNVLHIEDHNGIVELVQLLCNHSEPFYVEAVHTLAEAEERLYRSSYDLLLIDLNLSDSKGLDTVKSLRRYNIPMVVLTADPTESFARHAAKLGVADYITKGVLSKIDLPCRLRFVRDKSVAISKSRSTIKWQGLDQLKQYLSCSAFV